MEHNKRNADQYNPLDPVPSQYTQIVWKDTQQVGCAVAYCDEMFDPGFGTALYYVCEYFPAGNVIGEFGYVYC